MLFSYISILNYFFQRKQRVEETGSSSSKERFKVVPSSPLVNHSSSGPHPTTKPASRFSWLSFFGSTETTPIPEIETPLESGEITTKERPRLWALIIGINDYINVRKLRGAVSDADAMSQFLQNKLNVPASQIVNLRDGAATRSEIIAGFEALETNNKITPGDPILIYFAGHGGELPPTEEHPTKTQALIPIDFVPEEGSELASELGASLSVASSQDPQAEAVKPIPDRTVASLINGIAKRHGDNITVVLDCCHSGSGTRGGEDGTRGISLSARDFSPDLDSRIVHAKGNEPVDGTRGLHHAEGFAQKGMGSHVLLAACSAGELAREGGHGPETRGRFTTALLQLFESVSPDQITYADVLTRMPPIEGQNPQCEGLNKHRRFFHSKVIPPIRKSYVVKVVDGPRENPRKRIMLDAGKAHGITDGAEFTLYKTQQDIPDSPLGVMVAKDSGPRKIEAFTTLLQCTSGSHMATMIAGDPTVAIQTKAGALEDLKIYVPIEEIYYPVFQAIADELAGSGPNPCRIILERDRDKANLEIVAVGEDKFAFDILDQWTKEYEVSRMPHTAYGKIDDTQDLQRILRGAAHYHHHLNVTQENNQVRKNVIIEFFELEEVDDADNPGADPVLKPVGPNLLQESGKIEYTIDDDEEARYGMRITNNSSLDLYFVCLYFDHSDFSIAALTETDPQTEHQKDYMLNKGEIAEIGYGSLGIPPLENVIPEGQDLCLGFLKIYFTSQVVDLSKVPQATPFEGVRGLRTAQPRNKPSWGTVVIPIVQRRAK